MYNFDILNKGNYYIFDVINHDNYYFTVLTGDDVITNNNMTFNDGTKIEFYDGTDITYYN